MRWLVAFAAILLLGIAHDPVGASARGWFPRQAGECGWVYGRYGVYNGSGLSRIWIVGTTHMVSQPDDVNGIAPELDLSSGSYPGLGGSVRDFVFGDFYICAIDSYRRGHMQHVLIRKARNRVLYRAD